MTNQAPFTEPCITLSTILKLLVNLVFVTSMGQLLLNWLNDEIQLSRRITNFEEDFHNGFLFGQLLAKYSQQLNFHEFVDKDDKASRVKNFSLLLETLTALRVTFDANIAFNVINRKFGVAKKLLYELKTQLQKTNDNVFSKTNKMSKTLTPLKKIQITKQKFDQVQKQHFVKQLNELHPAQKEIIQHQLLKKFNDFHLTSLTKVAQADEKDRQVKLLQQKKFYEHQRDSINKSEQFSKQWQAEGREKWRNNMTIREIQITKDNQFKQREQQQRIKNKINSEASALKAVENDIAEFQRRNLKSRKGKQPSSDEDQAPKETTIKAKPQREGPIVEARQERRIPNGENEKKKHQRQKRRRKMIVQQMKKYQMIEINRRERCIIATIEQTSKQEKEIQYEIWRAWQNKHIIIENKAIETEKIKQKDETRNINAKFKKDELLKTYREEHKKEVDQALSKMTQLQRVHQARSRKGIYSECEKMVYKLLEITQKMYESAQERNSEQLDQSQLQEEFVKFTTETPDGEESSLKLKHYVQGSHEWNIEITRPQQEVSTNPKEDNSLPNETINNFYLGNILKTVFEKHYQNSSSDTTVSAPDRIVISLMGLEFTRKHQVARVVADKYKFQIIEVEKLIEQKLKDWTDFQAKGIEISSQTNEIATQCFAGREINEKTIVKLVSEQIQKHKKAIILDYPNTYEQAIELCRLISGVQPHDLLQKDKLVKKIEEFSRLVKPNDPKIVEMQTKGCGIDFVWWINVSAENSFDRMLGRRWINEQVVNIYDEVDPDMLKEGEKASALAMRNHFKLKNKLKLQDWFSLFGIRIEAEDINQKCWQTIEGNVNNEQLLTKMVEKVNEVQALKQKQRIQSAKLAEQKKKAQEQAEKLQAQKQAIKQKCIKSNPQNLKSQLGVALNKVDIQKAFIDQIAEVWNRIESTTISSFRKVFESLSEQQKSKRSYIAHLKRNFIALLTRQDHKFYLIKDFQRNYNEFITANEDMLAFQYTKEELHQRVEDLQNDLLTIVQEKKEDAITERNSIMGSGWLQAQIDLIYECLYLLIQSQLNRFAVSEKIIIDFYAKKFMCNTKTFEPLSPQINSESYAALEGIKENLCPKLDKIISEALRILNREQEVVDDKNKKGGKGAPPKKDDKKAAKKGGKQEVQEVKEPTAEEIEMKGAVNTEKAILRQRLNRIKTLGYRLLVETLSSANKLYAQLEDLYVYTHKVEQKAVFGLSKIFKRAIENEQKIENEVQIKHVEVIHTQLIRNFEKQKPIIQPARQSVRENHFTLGNLEQIFRMINNESEGSKISTKRLTVLLTKLISSESLRKLIPKTWRSLKTSNIESFVQLLDRNNQGYVGLAELYMFLAMTGFTIPTPTQIEQYTLELSNYSSLKQVNLEKFITTKAWFDEQIITMENIRPFDRNKEIKRVLFGIFQTEDNIVRINAYLSALNLDEIERYKELRRGEETYFEAAYS